MHLLAILDAMTIVWGISVVGTIILEAEVRRARRALGTARANYGATEAIVNGVILGPLALVLALIELGRVHQVPQMLRSRAALLRANPAHTVGVRVEARSEN